MLAPLLGFCLCLGQSQAGEAPDAIAGEIAAAERTRAAPVATEAAAAPPWLELALSLRFQPTATEETAVAAGPSLAARYLGFSPWRFGAWLASHHSSAANDSWDMARTGLLAGVEAGLARDVGAGRFFASLSLGAELLLEARTRQDAARLAGMPQAEAHWSDSLGPFAAVEAGARIAFWGELAAEAAIGGFVSRQTVATKAATALGVTGRLGLSYAL